MKESFILFYLFLLCILSLYGAHRIFILFLYFKHYKRRSRSLAQISPCASYPPVTIQIPLFNEVYVTARIIQSLGNIKYPKERLDIQILDDSTDETQAIAQAEARRLAAKGWRVRYIHRAERKEHKAGALQNGLEQTQSELVAIFDADFIPPPDFLEKTVAYFSEPKIGMVQARWGYLNRGYSFLTRMQAILLDGHFMLEHTARHFSGRFFNFNGTAGIWRRQTILDAGGWKGETLTEDLDLSYRAQMKGWRFVYLPDLVCPSELPVEVSAFKTQQHRWAKGSIQVSKKILPAIWKSKLPFRIKLESSFHLGANVNYLLVLILSLFMPLYIVFRAHFKNNLSFAFLDTFLLMATLPPTIFFYLTAYRESSEESHVSLKEIVPALVMGISMCVSNATAVLEALLSRKTPFVRTAKYHIVTRSDGWMDKQYKSSRIPFLYFECGMTIYMLLSLLILIHYGAWSAIPFLALFIFGYGYITILNFIQARTLHV